jgi:N-acetyl-gamma-glutamyl-phosphate/LysW-gamma-L-alpha-aminoadipyl-6-phosphate reductase
MLNVGIIGASGYAGGELLRLLLSHPKVKVVCATSERYKGISVGLVHPNLRKITDLRFISMKEIKQCDLIFLSLPNGVSQELFDQVKDKAKKIVDLGADFRLKDEKEWKKWYEKKHLRPQLLGKFVFGLPEVNREAIKNADWVACPGCEATVSILALYPALANHLIESERIIIDAKMSSSQAGKNFSLATHHPERAGAVRSYAPVKHRHTAEIEMVLKKIDPITSVFISATSIDMVRGILVTIHTWLKKNIAEETIVSVYRQFAEKEFFVRWVRQKRGIYRYPEPKILIGTNYCDIGIELDKEKRRLVVIAAIDNLTKGTAGQALQCMNLMAGFDETLGLKFSGLHPI